MTLAKYIEDNLKQRICAQDSTLDSLTLASLSKHYQVSAMPVRSAVKALIEQGYLTKLTNGKILVTDNLDSLKKIPPGEIQLNPHEKYSLVRKDVVKRCLMGESNYLRIGELAEQFQLGRTHAQGILHRLAAEGVLQHSARRGWEIRPVTIQDMNAYIEVRVAIEWLALNSIKKKLSTEKLEKLLAANQPGLNQSASSIDNSLHRYWVRMANNRYILDFFDRQGRFYETLYQEAPIDAKKTNEIASQHRVILEALLNKRWSVAKNALEVDIRSLKPILIQGIDQLNREKS